MHSGGIPLMYHMHARAIFFLALSTQIRAAVMNKKARASIVMVWGEGKSRGYLKRRPGYIVAVSGSSG